MEITQQEWDEVRAQVKSVYNVISGQDPLNKHKPLLERIAALEQGQKYVKVFIIAFAIGLLAAALAFGIITVKQFSEAIKQIPK